MSVHVQCWGSKCVVTGMISIEDFFVFRYFPNRTHFIVLDNLQFDQLDISHLNPTRSANRNNMIQNSKKLKGISIPTMSVLRTLDIKRTGLSSIGFEDNVHLRSLMISYSYLSSIPPTIFRAQGLKILEISSSSIRTIDFASFCDLPELKKLLLSDNKIRSIVNSCTKECKLYESLEGIDLTKNRLKTLSMTPFSQLTALSKLILSNNLLRMLSGVYVSDELQILDLSCNKLRSFSVCQWRIPFLQTLRVDTNQLTELPACLDNIRSLNKLSLESNHLSALEMEELAWLDNLQYLHLNGNNLRTLTLNSSEFPMKLELLEVERNNITELNLWCVPVASLRVNADHNLITSIDINATSTNISTVFLRENPIDCSWQHPARRFISECNDDSDE